MIQLGLTISLGLLALGLPALCWPQMDENLPFDPSEAQDREGEMEQEDYDFANSQENEPQLSADVKKELQKQLGNRGGGTEAVYFQQEPEMPDDVVKEMKMQIAAGRRGEALIESTSNGRVLKHGSAIALQLVQNDLWLSCNRVKYCATEPCPGLFFDSPDGATCRGEAFWIYRAKGYGNILTGDLVGLYYRSNTWFSMTGSRGQRSYCPGTINPRYGFNNCGKWYSCGGEVFQVYAKGKGIGATITDQDTIALYYPCGNTYVQFLSYGQYGSTCLLNKSALSRPPRDAAFDQCKGDSVEITIFR